MKSIEKIFVNVKKNERSFVMLILIIFISNFFTFYLLNRSSSHTTDVHPSYRQGQTDQRSNIHHASHTNAHFSNQKTLNNGKLYLLDQAATYVYDLKGFEQKVKEVAQQLEIPAEWLMAVMHSESRFDASVKNIQGSGATGLIQFMPTTAKDHEITVDKLRNLNHVDQMNFVYQYLNNKRVRYRKFKSLTDLYLAILYPKALEGGPCYELYATPSKAYKMNKGLDEDKDGRVTVSDIDRRMRRKYKSAYIVDLDERHKEKQGFFSGMGASFFRN